jgi:pyridoxal phosphate enzyme (YggS family)
MDITGNIAQARSEIKKAIDNSAIATSTPLLLAASKGQGEAAIKEAIASGVTEFGENRVQEAADKWPAIKQRHPSVRLHLIGALQSNKADEAAALFDVIQTLDRPRLADALAKAFTKTGRWLPCYIQVNTGKETQKAGVLPEDADALIAYCKQLGITIEGLMCIPPHDQPPAPHFAYLRQLAIKNGISGLSMGMSEDYREAIRMGASCVRLGRTLFGERL